MESGLVKKLHVKKLDPSQIMLDPSLIWIVFPKMPFAYFLRGILRLGLSPFHSLCTVLL